MRIETELFNDIFENEFFRECNSLKYNKNWEEIFQDLYIKNIKYYQGRLEKEYLEKGISGYIKKEKDRDALQDIKKDVLNKKIDVLLML